MSLLACVWALNGHQVPKCCGASRRSTLKQSLNSRSRISAAVRGLEGMVRWLCPLVTLSRKGDQGARTGSRKECDPYRDESLQREVVPSRWLCQRLSKSGQKTVGTNGLTACHSRSSDHRAPDLFPRTLTVAVWLCRGQECARQEGGGGLKEVVDVLKHQFWRSAPNLSLPAAWWA